MKTFSRPHYFLTIAVLGLTACATGGSRRPVATLSSTPSVTLAVTGIASCDHYLAIYRTCHQEAHTYAAVELDAHYQNMHDTLLSESKDPKTSPLLANRCRLLTQQIMQAAHDPACGNR